MTKPQASQGNSGEANDPLHSSGALVRIGQDHLFTTSKRNANVKREPHH
jgi:hypothetical protein